MDDTPGRVDTGVSRRPGQRGEDRATQSVRGYAGPDRDDADERTRELRHEIEETRGEMGETIDAIQEKLKPRNIVSNATDRVKTAATERVREMADTASQTTQQAMDYTRNRAGGLVDVVRKNPIPLTLIGIGAAWLITNRSRRTVRYDESRWDRDSRAYGSTWRDTTGESGTRARQYVSETADSVRRMARRRQNRLQRMVQENPLLVGAGALMLGAAFGLAVPETEAENAWMGETRDNMVERAREAARDAANQVQDAASSVADAAKTLTGKPQS